VFVAFDAVQRERAQRREMRGGLQQFECESVAVVMRRAVGERDLVPEKIAVAAQEAIPALALPPVERSLLR
jgi:hypothetical protein